MALRTRRPAPMAIGALIVLMGVLLAGCRNQATSPVPAGAAPAEFAWSLPTQDVGVDGTHMTLDGQPWMSRGVTLQALVRPAAALHAHGDPALLAALDNYGPAELASIKQFGADTLRFQVSQPALDSASPLYDPRYNGQVTDAVHLARAQGFVVLLMMQDEDITGETAKNPMPTTETMAGWRLLNQTFGGDTGVLYELYNEPRLAASSTNWAAWERGGTPPGSVGMQAMISALRDAGSRNVLVLDGLDGAKTLRGAPAPQDPRQRLVYAVHPYLGGSADESGWDPDFGQQSATRPVWVDEWSAATRQKIGLGDLSDPQPAIDFVNYVRSHSLPLCAGAFDVPGFMVQNVPGWTPTNYDHLSSPTPVHDAGELIHQLFVTHYGRPLTRADARWGLR